MNKRKKATSKGGRAMLAILLALRDALIIIALNWVGVTLEPAAREPAPVNEPAAASSADNAFGGPDKPSFNNLGPCPDR